MSSTLWAFAVYRGVQGFDTLRPEWEDLASRLPRASYLQTPQWFGSYLHALAEHPDATVFIAARRGGQLAAVFPLRISHRSCAGWRVPTLETITGEHLDLTDIAWDDDASGLGPAFLGWMERQRELSWHVLKLSRLRSDSAVSRWLQQRPPARSLHDGSRTTAWLECSQGLEQALQSVSRSHRNNVKRLIRRAQGMGELRYEVVTDAARLPAALETFLQIEASGWKGEAGTAIARHARHRGFYERLVSEFGALGACRINLLWLDQAPIAAQFGLVRGRQLNLLKIGFSQEHAQVAPGNVVMYHTIESVCSDPALDRLSFVTHPPWAHLWKPELTTVEEHTVFRSTAVGQLLFHLTRRKRERERERLERLRDAAAQDGAGSGDGTQASDTDTSVGTRACTSAEPPVAPAAAAQGGPPNASASRIPAGATETALP